MCEAACRSNLLINLRVDYFILIEHKVSSEIDKIFKNTPKAELQSKLEDLILDVPSKRKKYLYEILIGKEKLVLADGLDIKIYALKYLFPSEYESLKLKESVFSSSDFYQYDPAKNGQNIIKHEISFRAVISHSTQFGTLIVPCPDKNKGRRVVIFSDYFIKNDNHCLSGPLGNAMEEETRYTLTVAQQYPGYFRFISSRFISKQRLFKTMKNAFKNIYTDNPDLRKLFVEHCIETLKRDLFKSNV